MESGWSEAYSEEVDVSVVGTYTLLYQAVDGAGNAAASVTRTVVVLDTTAPTIQVFGFINLVHEAGTFYVDAGKDNEARR